MCIWQVLSKSDNGEIEENMEIVTETEPYVDIYSANNGECLLILESY